MMDGSSAGEGVALAHDPDPMSRSPNRQAAGVALADALLARSVPVASDPVVVALPRGGVPVAAVVARAARTHRSTSSSCASSASRPSPSWRWEPSVKVACACSNREVIDALRVTDAATRPQSNGMSAANSMRRSARLRAGRRTRRPVRSHRHPRRRRAGDREHRASRDRRRPGAGCRLRRRRGPGGTRRHRRELSAVADDVVCVATPEPFCGDRSVVPRLPPHLRRRGRRRSSTSSLA